MRTVSPLYARRGFTLIELLTVIAIIGILAGITFGIVKGVRTRAAVGKARTELAVIAQALESYKSQYGDYPQTGGATVAPSDTTATAIATSHAQSKLFNALAGKLGPKLDGITGKTYVELTKFTLETTDMPLTTGVVEVANAFIDPWGRRYMYYYKNTGSPAAWRTPGYVLYSVGPDGVETPPVLPAGTVDHDDANNVDNLYANR